MPELYSFVYPLLLSVPPQPVTSVFTSSISLDITSAVLQAVVWGLVTVLVVLCVCVIRSAPGTSQGSWYSHAHTNTHNIVFDEQWEGGILLTGWC